jgi:hypothetical protein
MDRSDRPEPPIKVGVRVSGVSCISTVQCVAVGDIGPEGDTDSSLEQPIAERYG